MAKYKGIEFAEGYNRPFADFQKTFETSHVFKAIHPKERLKELKKAWKIATKATADGHFSKASKQRKKVVKPTDSEQVVSDNYATGKRVAEKEQKLPEGE